MVDIVSLIINVSVFLGCVGFIIFLLVFVPSRDETDAWVGVRESGARFLEDLEGSGWSIYRVASLPEQARNTFIESAGYDPIIISAFIDWYSKDPESFKEVDEEVLERWWLNIDRESYKVTRQALRRALKNGITFLPR